MKKLLNYNTTRPKYKQKFGPKYKQIIINFYPI